MDDSLIGLDCVETAVSVRTHRGHSAVHWCIANKTRGEHKVASPSTTIRRLVKI